MADENLFDQGLEKPTNTTPTSGNLFDQGLSGGGSASASVPPPAQVASVAPSGNLFDAGLQSPVNGQSGGAAASEGHLYQDSSQPWYKRAFDWAQTPLTESLLGWGTSREGAGGFERGAEHVLSGLTSPLSLALTAATFGGGGLAESAGATALKESGEFAADEIPSIIKASKAATQAVKDLEPGSTAVEDAVRATGIDPARLKTAQDILAKNGLSAHDLAGGNGLENGAFQILHKYLPDVPIAGSVRAAKTANTIMNAGFTYQQLESAAAMSPRFLDALKEGDSDKAWEYGTEAVAGGALGVAGAGHAIRSWGELTAPLLDPASKLRPTDTTIAVNRTFGEKEAEHAVAEQTAIDINKKANDLLGPKPSPLEKTMATLDVHTGVGGPESQGKAGAWYNALSEAAGRPDRVSVGSGTPAYHGSPVNFEGPPKTDGLGAHFTLSKDLADKFSEGKGKVVEASLGIKNPLRIQDYGGSHSNAEDVIKDFVKRGVLPDSFLKNVDSRIYQRSEKIVGDIGDLQGPELAKKRNDAFQQANTEELEKVKSYLKSKGYDGLVYDNKVEGHGDSYIAFDQNQIRPVNGLPNDIADKIKNSTFAKQSPEYQKNVLDSLKAIATDTVPDNVRSTAKYLREEEAKTAEIGGQTGLIKNFVDDHMTRRWKDDNPEGRVISSEAKAGKFSTSVSEARHRVYDSTLTGLLKSPTEMIFDPADATAQGRANLLKAAANKKFIGTVMDKGFRDSTGRPVAFLNGRGNVVAGENGEDPSIFIDSNRANIRKLNIPEDQIAKMSASGDLQRFLDNGDIKDVTPYVRQDNINGAISKLEDQAGRQEAKYDPEGNNILRQKIDTLKAIQQNKNWDALKEFNDAQPKIMSWDPSGYVSLAQDAVKGWNFATNAPDGTPVYTRSDVLVSPEYADYFKNRLGLDESAIANNPIGKALLAGGAAAKHVLLDLSPFHLVQEALRGIMVGINPITAFREALKGNHPNVLSGDRIDPNDPNSPTKQYVGVQQGLTTGVNYKALQAHSEGAAEGLTSGDHNLLRKIPGIGKVVANAMQGYQDFLFKKYIPALKARGYELMFDRYRDAHSDWSTDKIAKAAALHTNNTFGGINWRAMGRSATTQDWGRLVALAPDWLESEARSGAALFNKDQGGLSREQMVKMTMSLWGIARVLNLVSTGNAHLESPFGLAVKNKDTGKETIFGIRTLPTDLMAAATDPVRFLKGRLSPGVRMGEELLSGRDQFQRKLSPQDLWVDVFRNMAPIPVQSVGAAISGNGPEIGNVGQTVKALGGTVQTYQTPAQKMAAELASNHNEDGPVDSAQMHRHAAIIRLEDQVRSGQVAWPELYQMVYQTNQLHESELKKIQQVVKNTREMDPGTAALYSRAARLPAKEYFDLYDQMNPSERVALIPLTKQVMRRYLTKSQKDMTPQERATDPLVNRIVRMLPQLEATQSSQ